MNIGTMFGFLLGGWLSEEVGWRLAFLIVGAPGILLAVIIRFTLAEPARGVIENRQATSNTTTIRDVVVLLWSWRSFRHIAIAGGLNAFVQYSVANWTASFLIRSHGMSTGEVGFWLAMILGIGGAIDVLGGGIFSDRLGVHDKRWYL